MADERTTASRPKVSSTTTAANGKANPQPSPSPSGKTKTGSKKDEHARDVVREIFETVVFVVVLVLMLKTFVAEAFVIPTGSMAETLYGYQKVVTCDECGYVFPVNCSSEVDPQDGNQRTPIIGCHCPNCQHAMSWAENGGPDWGSGDRVLVAKFLFDDDNLWTPKRHQVIVFKYPEAPQKGPTAMNYIKRCEGLSTETIAIFNGNLYVTTSLKYPHHPMDNVDKLQRWQREYMFSCDPTALELFEKSMVNRMDGKINPDDFEIIRKPPEEILSMRRIVNNNDFQPKDRKGVQRWQFTKGRWSGDNAAAPKVYSHSSQATAEGLEWITYQHLLRPEHVHYGEQFNRPSMPSNPSGFEKDEKGAPEQRRLITDMQGYNTGEDDRNKDVTGKNWVGDLMLDCEVQITDAQGEFVMELSKGIDRFQARFDLSNGKCKLIRRTGRVEETRVESVLAEKETNLKKKGTYHVRFANFDEQLTVWVDSQLPFGNGVPYPPAKELGPVGENDILAPARLGVQGGNLSVSHLQLWRDTYYTLNEQQHHAPISVPNNPEQRIQTFYVQPGHYLALGDNSSASSDSRYWGLVPQRLLLGRALWVYYPFRRFGGIE